MTPTSDIGYILDDRSSPRPSWPEASVVPADAELWLIRPEFAQAGMEALHKAEAHVAEADKPESFFFGGGGKEDAPETVRGVRIVRIEGVMIADANLPTWLCSLFGLVQTPKIRDAVLAADADDEVERIALVIDSPGGQVDGIAELAEVVGGCSTPVSAYAAGMCASAAYWTASAAERIVAAPTATVGSVGAVVQVRREKKSDYETLTIASSQTPRKRMDPFDSDSGKREAARKDLQEYVDALAEVFIGAVRKNRPEGVGPLDGRVVVGEAAVDGRLADGIGYYRDELSRKESGMSGNLANTDSTAEAAAEVVALPVADSDRVRAIMALPGSDAAKLKAVAEGLSVAEAAKSMLEDSGAAHVAGMEAHESETEFPATHAKAAEGEDAIVAECLSMWDKYGKHVPNTGRLA